MKSRLNFRQRELRKEFIRAGGILNTPEIADRFGVSRQRIWMDLKRIQQEAPVRGLRTGTGDWNESREVEAQLQRFEDMITQADEEIQRIEQEIDQRHRGKAVPNLLRAKVHAHGHRLAIVKARADFLLGIGWFTPAVKRIQTSRDDLAALKGEALDDKIRELDQLLGPDPCGHTDALIDEEPLPEVPQPTLDRIRKRRKSERDAAVTASKGQATGATRDPSGRFVGGVPRRKEPA